MPESYEEPTVTRPDPMDPRRRGDPAPPTGIPAADRKSYRMCVHCGAGENPRSNLRFVDKGPDDKGPYCEICFKRRFGEIEGVPTESIPRPADVGLAKKPAQVFGDLVVIPCPHCVYRDIADCPTCANYRRVRIPAASLPIYIPPTKETNDEDQVQ